MITISTEPKPHFEILDGLRGIASIMVVILHLFESHSTNHLDQVINHGYLAVDFFFLLSGFVIGYAYDDRWERMSVGQFFTRRVFRLQPMVIMGMIVGAIFFYFQASSVYPLIRETPIWKMLIEMLLGFNLIPVTPSYDIRGRDEMFPLNGPAWTLFLEYIANILYALLFRRFSKKVLGVLIFLTGCAVVHLALTSPNGDVIGGWALNETQVRFGFTRLMFPFLTGLLLSRLGIITKVKNAFIWCSLIVIIIFSIPRIGGSEHLWMNGLYDSICIILVFPFVVFLGASGEVKGNIDSHICKFLGDISYPLYITHYPLILVYHGWAVDGKHSFREIYPIAILSILLSIIFAYICLKFYDEPVRHLLSTFLYNLNNKQSLK